MLSLDVIEHGMDVRSRKTQLSKLPDFRPHRVTVPKSETHAPGETNPKASNGI
jgi:hypothetical protein